jgi:BirA family transcriptional regulator, biotin operon repressor / biotin---[acetyl-CoA-carboxylase] ligase
MHFLVDHQSAAIMEDDLTTWPDALQAELDAGDGPLQRVTVIRETESTQDAARRFGATAGEVIVAARQTRGRGRLGSAWADTADRGIAVTFVLPREAGERLAFVSAVATAVAAEDLVGDATVIGIKWPNDIYANDRKLAGILIEQHDELALVGIGMNVLQRSWPDELADRAISLAQLGVNVARLEALRSLLRAMNDVVTWPASQLTEAFHMRHLLRDQKASFTIGSERCTGRVIGMCIERGLCIETDSGQRWLAAATTRAIETGCE